MAEMFQEYADSRGVAVRVDRQQGVIRGVKILGLQSRNGRVYRPEALVEAAPFYEGAKVNVNHARPGAQGARDYQDRIGVIRSVASRSDGLYADLAFNPKHALAEQLLWDAEHAPENVGFSHNVEARVARSADRVVVEAIVRVESVDLVADPATTRGLFESAEARATGAVDAASIRLAEATIDDVRRHRPELAAALAAERAAAAQRLEEEIGRLRAAEALRARRERVRAVLREFDLPDPDSAEGLAQSLVSAEFLETLLAAADDEAMRRLAADRAKLVEAARGSGPHDRRRAARPCSRDQYALDLVGPGDVAAFVGAITD